MRNRFDTYVAVFMEEGGYTVPRFVTGIPSHNSAVWEAGKPAMPFTSQSYAEDVVQGLTLNGYPAAVVRFLHGVEVKNPD